MSRNRSDQFFSKLGILCSIQASILNEISFNSPFFITGSENCKTNNFSKLTYDIKIASNSNF